MQKKREFTWPSQTGKDLIKTFLKIKNSKTMELFLRDICTIKELQAMSERWQAAQMIKKGISYRKIAEETGISTATVTRVAHWMKYGAGGYEKVMSSS